VSEAKKDVREAWSEVGHEVGELGRVVRSHFQAEPTPAGPEAATSETAVSGGPEVIEEREMVEEPARFDDLEGAARAPGAGGSRAAVEDAVRKVSHVVQRFGGQANETVRDPAVRVSAQKVARSFGDAVSITFIEVRDDVRTQLRERRGGKPDGSAPPSQLPSGTGEPAAPGGPRTPEGSGGDETPPPS
jgi:hypothetical protein